ncbi:MAG: hypothetical protein C5B47_03520 [Verrucomicrobia bacterium]|nr:MAG: hypothetical protein C5B47_03520 [Verrucomicrobiota bacterium]
MPAKDTTAVVSMGFPLSIKIAVAINAMGNSMDKIPKLQVLICVQKSVFQKSGSPPGFATNASHVGAISNKAETFPRKASQCTRINPIANARQAIIPRMSKDKSEGVEARRSGIITTGANAARVILFAANTPKRRDVSITRHQSSISCRLDQLTRNKRITAGANAILSRA